MERNSAKGREAKGKEINCIKISFKFTEYLIIKKSKDKWSWQRENIDIAYFICEINYINFYQVKFNDIRAEKLTQELPFVCFSKFYSID